MKAGLDLFLAVCQAKSLAAEVKDLSDEELETLDEWLEELPATSIPGVVGGQVAYEIKLRWRRERVAERERATED